MLANARQHYILHFFFQKCYFTAWFGTDLFIVVERSKDIMHVYSAANDPRPQMIPRPQIIPKLHIKKRSSHDVNYDKFNLFFLDNSSENLLEKNQPIDSTSSIYNNNSLMLPKLRHKNLSQILFGCHFQRDFLRHKTVKTNDKIRCFGVVMTPSSRKI